MNVICVLRAYNVTLIQLTSHIEACFGSAALSIILAMPMANWWHVLAFVHVVVGKHKTLKVFKIQKMKKKNDGCRRARPNRAEPSCIM